MGTARIVRCLRLRTLLESGERPKVADLARLWAVCRRTVFRDLRLLKEAKIDPPESSAAPLAASRPGYAVLSLDEAMALIAALRASTKCAEAGHDDAFDRAMVKLLAAAEPDNRPTAAGCAGAMAVPQPSATDRGSRAVRHRASGKTARRRRKRRD